MALDRKIRIGISTSELLAAQDYDGEDVEIRMALGRTELARNFDLLMRGRDRPNGILGEGEELSASDTLVKAAESALKNQMPDVAERAVLSFLLQSPPKNQFFCRALFVQAQLQSSSILTSGATGDDLVVGTLKAVDFVLTAMRVAMDEKNRPRYDFLVYNASVHYWNVIRPLLRQSVQRFLVGSFTYVVQCLTTTNDDDAAWRCQLSMALARCCDDASDVGAALDHASAALDLLDASDEQTTTTTVNKRLLSDVRSCVVHMCRHGAGSFVCFCEWLISLSRFSLDTSSNVVTLFVVTSFVVYPLFSLSLSNQTLFVFLLFSFFFLSLLFFHQMKTHR